jgi:hypothetical protein
MEPRAHRLSMILTRSAVLGSAPRRSMNPIQLGVLGQQVHGRLAVDLKRRPPPGQDAEWDAVKRGSAEVERYLAAKSHKKSIADDQRHLTTFTTAFGADAPLAELTAARISAWKAERLAAVSPQTKAPYSAAAINRPLATLRHLLRLARDEWEVLAAARRIRLEREPQGRVR